MLLLADIDGDARAAAHRVAGDLLTLLKPAFVVEGQDFEIAASIGVALFPAHGETMTDLLKHADAALYEAKRDGRGTIRFAPPLLSAQAGA
jgi:diguanylate cyclase (GGDEF)-like protein